tara:strand:+ start:2119 stop:2367 length:249 start_codon:yes stop_codon:yes gene_type:complete
MINRRRRKKVMRRLAPAFVLAGGAVGASVIGSAMPGDTGAGLQSASSGFAGFVGPAATVGGGMILIDTLQELNPRRRKRRRR